MAVTTEKELAKQLEANAERIEIEGNLGNKIIRIKATGKVAWAIAFGAIAVAVAGVIAAPATGGASGTASLFAAPAAIGILGSSATLAAISIAVAAGGIGALKKLRKYRIVEKSPGWVVIASK